MTAPNPAKPKLIAITNKAKVAAVKAAKACANAFIAASLLDETGAKSAAADTAKFAADAAAAQAAAEAFWKKTFSRELENLAFIMHEAGWAADAASAAAKVAKHATTAARVGVWPNL